MNKFLDGLAVTVIVVGAVFLFYAIRALCPLIFAIVGIAYLLTWALYRLDSKS